MAVAIVAKLAGERHEVVGATSEHTPSRRRSFAMRNPRMKRDAAPELLEAALEGGRRELMSEDAGVVGGRLGGEKQTWRGRESGVRD